MAVTDWYDWITTGLTLLQKYFSDHFIHKHRNVFLQISSQHLVMIYTRGTAPLFFPPPLSVRSTYCVDFLGLTTRILTEIF
jgi:hypothetical protein